MIKRFNENFTDQLLYLIEEDGGDCLYAKGVYNNIDKFIEQMKISLSAKQGWEIDSIVVEKTDTDITLKHDYSYEKYVITQVSINKLLDY